ncbi:Sodium/proton antiporter 1 [Citrus sinensis]|nr:Sodium/proton antiporter 1 [Citrus sinensis]
MCMFAVYLIFWKPGARWRVIQGTSAVAVGYLRLCGVPLIVRDTSICAWCLESCRVPQIVRGTSNQASLLFRGVLELDDDVSSLSVVEDVVLMKLQSGSNSDFVVIIVLEVLRTNQPKFLPEEFPSRVPRDCWFLRWFRLMNSCSLKAKYCAPSTEIAVSELSRASAEVSEIVFFLLGAMTIVEIVDAHQGFKLVTDNITTRKPRSLLWCTVTITGWEIRHLGKCLHLSSLATLSAVGFVSFFLSSILDNLTATIVMVSLVRKLVPPSEYRKLLGAVVVIAANAGGVWSPIGDVTTTMLWIHGQISTLPTMKLKVWMVKFNCKVLVNSVAKENDRSYISSDVNFESLFIPSAVSLAVPLALLSLTSEVNRKGQESSNVLASEQMAPRGQLVSTVGTGALIFVPVFKALTGLPPYMGILLGLGVLWILTDAIHYGESERQKLKVPQALSRINMQVPLFFLGILLSVSSLEAAGLMRKIGNYLDAHIPNIDLIASAIGVVSAVIDNVPLVAATIGMYDLTSLPQDSEFWQLIAYCASTGGSMLIIGSAAGVTFMGMEKVDFFWYFRKVSGFAFAGYAAGIAAYLAVNSLHFSLRATLAQAPIQCSLNRYNDFAGMQFIRLA